MLKSIGHGNSIEVRSIVAVIRTDSAPFKKLRCRAEEERMLINATGGRKVRSAIITSSNHLILSALQATTLKERLNTEGGRHGHRHGG